MTIIYRYDIPASALRKSDPGPFKPGDRVRAKQIPEGVDPKYWTGVVRSVPEAPVIQLGSQSIGNEIAVDSDEGGTFVVSDHTQLEMEEA